MKQGMLGGLDYDYTTLQETTEADGQSITDSIKAYDTKQNATLGEWSSALGVNALESSSLPNMQLWWKQTFTDDQEPDDNWLNLISDTDYLWSQVNQLGGDSTLFHDLSKTQNDQQYTTVVERFFEKKQHGERVNRYLDEVDMISSGLAGGIFLSPENLASFGLFGIAYKTGRLAGKTGKLVLASDMTMISSTSAIQHHVDPVNYTETDVAIDIGLGGLFTGVAFKALSKSESDKIANLRNEAPTANNEIMEEMSEPKPMDIDVTTPTGETIKARNLGAEQATVTKINNEIEAADTARKADLIEERDALLDNISVSNKLEELAPMLEKEKVKGSAYKELKSLKESLVTKIDNARNSKAVERLNTAVKKIDNVLRGQVRKIDVAKKTSIADINHKKTGMNSIQNDAWRLSVDKVDKSLQRLEDRFNNMSTNPKYKVDEETIADINNFIDHIFQYGKKKNIDRLQMALGDAFSDIKLRNDMKMRKNKDGSYTLSYKGAKMRGKIPAVVALSLLGSTSAMADDGSMDVSEFSKFLVMAGLVGLAGAAAYKGFKSNSFKDFMEKSTDMVGSKVKTGLAKAKTKTFNENADSLVQSIRTGFAESYTSVSKHGKDAKAVMDKLVHNAFDGRTDNVSAIKDEIINKYSANYNRVDKEGYTNYLKAEGITKTDRISKVLSTESIRDEFRRYVTDYMEHGIMPKDITKEGKAAIKSVADNARKIYDDIFDEMSDAGMEVKKVGDYIPRLVSGDFRSLVKNIEIDGDSWNALKKNFAEMIVAKQSTRNYDKALEQADDYLNGLRTDKSDYWSSDRVISDLAVKAERAGADEQVIDNILSHIGDKANRTKHRIDMDLTKFKAVDIDVLGEVQNISLSNVFERNSATVMSDYLNGISGHIGLNRMGYKTPNNLDEEIRKVSSDTARYKLEQIKRLVLGDSILDPADPMTKLVATAKNLSTAILLPLVSLSLAPEMLKTTARVMTNHAGYKQLVSEFSNMLKSDMGSELADQLATFTGHGNSKHRIEVGFKGIGDLSNSEHMMSGSAVAISAKARDAVLLGSRMIHISDFMSRINMVANAETLAKYFNGTKKLNKFELEKFGVTDKTVKLLGDKLDLTKIGNLKKLDLESWTRAEQNEFKRIMHNMQQRYVQESTLGTSPLWSKTTHLGSFVSGLLQFPLQAYTNHGLFDIRGMATGDITSMANLMMWYTGGMISADLRATLSGREMSEQDLHVAALSSMPLAGIYGAATSITDGGASGAFLENAHDFLSYYGR
jgi:hypothetical protein